MSTKPEEVLEEDLVEEETLEDKINEIVRGGHGNKANVRKF